MEKKLHVNSYQCTKEELRKEIRETYQDEIKEVANYLVKDRIPKRRRYKRVHM